jgi:uncharacterized membrane protein YkoI
MEINLLRILKGTTLIAAAFFANAAMAGHDDLKPKSHDSLGKSVAAALAKHYGTIVKVEFKNEGKNGVYEFDIESADGTSWDIEVDAKSSKVTEVEQEVKADDVKFKEAAKVTEAVAKAKALAVHAGTVAETEYEIEADGKASYEFDITSTDAKEYKVEVDATTGKIVEDNEEVYQIGKE